MRIVPHDPRHITARTPPVSEIGYIHSVDSCGTVDGPGIRFIVFTTGCPLRCQYCHNPDALCKGDGKPRSVNSLLDEIGNYAGFIKRAGGGITVSGGEPLLQHHFVEALFKGVKKRFGLHTTLDTSGHGNPNTAASLLDVTDLVLLDIKSWNPDTYQKVTGQPIDACLRFARLLQQRNHPTWIRYVLVPGLTDDSDNLHGLAEFLRGMTCVERIELLSFHKMGEYKWDQLGLEYQLKNVFPPTRDQIRAAEKILSKSGKKVITGE